MTDFDFDELDKAVNTALGSVDDVSPQENTPPLGETPRIEPTAATPAQPPQSLSAPAARRSSGRFMDVVHPSSDMRTRSAVEVPTRLPQPAPSGNDVPAPLNEPDWKTPLDSPFLPDAQVEKRPLGGSSALGGEPLPDAPSANADLLLEEPDELRLEAPDELRLEVPDDTHIMPDPIDFATAGPTAEEPVESFAVVEEPINSESAPRADLSRAAALDAEVPPEIASVSADPIVTESSGPVAITQQYTEKPAEVAEPGAIYDTETYHQPITTPAKKKSGIWIILWIVLILAFGGGAGAVFYFVVLPTL